MSQPFPMQYEVPADNSVANWRPLVHWLLAIPHLIIAGVLFYVAEIVAFISWFVIVFTGKLPKGMANLMVMAMRYNARANSHLLGLTETYPPFSFDTVAEDPGDHDVTLSVQPALEGRNRLTVFFRLIPLIPLIAVGCFVWYLVAGVVMFIAWFAVLFTGRYPAGLRRITVGFFRFWNRVYVYGFLLVDDYPSLSLTD